MSTDAIENFDDNIPSSPSPDDIYKNHAERMKICKQCENLGNPLPFCKICKCFMPLKTRVPIAHCPIGKW
jgi:hypothetical protein